MPPCLRYGRQHKPVTLHTSLSLTNTRRRNSPQAAVWGGMQQKLLLGKHANVSSTL